MTDDLTGPWFAREWYAEFGVIYAGLTDVDAWGDRTDAELAMTDPGDRLVTRLGGGPWLPVDQGERAHVDEKKRYLATDDMAALTGKSRDFWASMCRYGHLQGVKLGNDWRVPSDVFEAFMRGGGRPVARKRYSSRSRRS